MDEVSSFVKRLVRGEYPSIRPLFFRRDVTGTYTCNICGLHGFTAKGLVLHITRKHRDVAKYVMSDLEEMKLTNGHSDVVGAKSTSSRIITVKLPVSVYSALKVVASKKNTSISVLIKNALGILSNTLDILYSTDTVDIHGTELKVFSIKLRGDEIELLSRVSSITGLRNSEIIRRLCYFILSDPDLVQFMTATVETVKIT